MHWDMKRLMHLAPIALLNCNSVTVSSVSIGIRPIMGQDPTMDC
jgi:hypothetical protein